MSLDRTTSPDRASRGRWPGQLRFALLGAVCAVAISTATLAAQNLSVAEQLVAAGRTAEAREMVNSWWDAYGQTAPAGEVQRGLWLRGRLTLDPSLAAIDYERLVAEFRGGPYSDDALLRLALAAEANGDVMRATERFEALARDYPTRPAGIEAAQWLETRPSERVASMPVQQEPFPPVEPESTEAEPSPPALDQEPPEPDADSLGPDADADPLEPALEAEPGPPPTEDGAAGAASSAAPTGPAAPVAVGAAGVTSKATSEPEAESESPGNEDATIETVVAPAAVPSDSTQGAEEAPVQGLPAAVPPATTTPEDVTPPQAEDVTFAVEVGAYLSQARAERMVERLAEREHDSRIVHVPGSPLFRVRVGRFPVDAEAEAVKSRLQAQDFTAAVVSDVEAEERMGSTGG